MEYPDLAEIYDPAESGGNAAASDRLLGKAWGRLEYTGGRNSGGLDMETSHRFATDYLSGRGGLTKTPPHISARHYLVIDGRRFGVQSAGDPNGRRERWMAMLTELS